MSSYVQEQASLREARIFALEQQIRDAEEQLVLARTELRIYQDILAHESKEEPAKEPQAKEAEGNRPSRVKKREGRKFTRKVRASGFNARMSPTMRRTFEEAMSLFPSSFPIGRVQEIAGELNESMTPQSIRSAFSTYTSRGLFERVGVGAYRPTPAGAAAAGIPWDPKSEHAAQDEQANENGSEITASDPSERPNLFG